MRRRGGDEETADEDEDWDQGEEEGDEIHFQYRFYRSNFVQLAFVHIQYF